MRYLHVCRVLIKKEEALATIAPSLLRLDICNRMCQNSLRKKSSLHPSDHQDMPEQHLRLCVHNTPPRGLTVPRQGNTRKMSTRFRSRRCSCCPAHLQLFYNLPLAAYFISFYHTLVHSNVLVSRISKLIFNHFFCKVCA